MLGIHLCARKVTRGDPQALQCSVIVQSQLHASIGRFLSRKSIHLFSADEKVRVREHQPRNQRTILHTYAPTDTAERQGQDVVEPPAKPPATPSFPLGPDLISPLRSSPVAPAKLPCSWTGTVAIVAAAVAVSLGVKVWGGRRVDCPGGGVHCCFSRVESGVALSTDLRLIFPRVQGEVNEDNELEPTIREQQNQQHCVHHNQHSPNHNPHQTSSCDHANQREEHDVHVQAASNYLQ